METEVKTDEIQEESTGQLFDETSEVKAKTPSPEEVKEVKEEVKEDKPEKTEVKPEVTPPSPAEKKEGEEVKVVDWDSEDNPHKTKAVELETRLKETRNWDTQLNQENVILKERNESLRKQYDPNYVESTPSPETEKRVAEFKGRLAASHKAAIDLHGEEHVNKMLHAPDSPFQQINKDPVVDMRVRNSDTPTLEALKIVKEYAFFNKYGRDTDKIEAKIKESLEPELKEKITKEFEKKLKLKVKQPDSLTGIKSETPDVEKETEFKPETTEQLFD